ncbi:hypothetical protein GALMADRAFT_69496 [Galerina marginata CBS 339.88]|uniref:C2H2-type domain-containing protein n=1 Tax=Galerina marginata (strain CBS 339.88) TaxID=685588 RepID=A0A067T7W9_GALM3|nr:hypothetical protein GALMADRAFT_69496 [Galerina marginata CBS 339.88]
MYNRDPRSFTYDDQNSAYPPSQIPHQSAEYTTTGYQQQPSSDQYYGQPTHGMENPSGPYFRSMTPSLAAAHRYPDSSRDPRYYHPQSFGASSSSATPYTTQNQLYPPQYPPTADQRPVPLGHTPHSRPHFIPTPSEIASSYSSYNHQMVTPHSPSTIPEDGYAPSDYPVSPHMGPSSHGGHGHRPSRITTGRPRTVSTAAASPSPTSASSPSGERFPCEKCGKTFSRSHDRKRHHETQHLPTPIFHVCPYCSKEFSRSGPVFQLLHYSLSFF